MAQEILNIGSIVNDGTGDPLRTGGSKIKNNFTELYLLTFKWCGNVAMSSNNLATLTGATGSGTAGAIKKADVFYNTASSTSLTAPDGSTLINAGNWIIALQDSPTLIGHFSFIPSTL